MRPCSSESVFAGADDGLTGSNTTGDGDACGVAVGVGDGATVGEGLGFGVAVCAGAVALRSRCRRGADMTGDQTDMSNDRSSKVATRDALVFFMIKLVTS